jgi:hypothetical protein
VALEHLRADVTERLMERFDGELPLETISDTVRDTARDLADQPVEDQAELVERVAAHRLAESLDEPDRE